jgi:hypothetical protein
LAPVVLRDVVKAFGALRVVSRMFDPRPVAQATSLSFRVNTRRMHLFDAATGASLAATP